MQQHRTKGRDSKRKGGREEEREGDEVKTTVEKQGESWNTLVFGKVLEIWL